MQRLVFEGGGHLVRLSANICQLHRPNTIPIFCAAVCRDYRLRTFREHDLNCYFYCPGADTGPEPEEELLPFPLPDGPPDETFPEPAPVGVVELLPG